MLLIDTIGAHQCRIFVASGALLHPVYDPVSKTKTAAGECSAAALADCHLRGSDGQFFFRLRLTII
jgi:hypothetical protein